MGTEPKGPRARGVPPGPQDCAVLAALVLLSLALYVGGLGFYSDDWAFLSLLDASDDPGVPELVALQIRENPNLELRPVQAAYQAVLYALFGLDPLPYHLVNAAVLVAMTILLYGALRELGVARHLAVAVPAVFALLPSYSTDRYWFAAFGYALSMALLFASLLADLRALRSPTAGRLLVWKALALLALAGSAFGFEVVLPLFLLNLVLLWPRARARLDRVGLAVFLGSNVALLALAAVYKALVATAGTGLYGDLGYHLSRLFSGVLIVNLGSYGAGLPHAAWWGLTHNDWAGLLLAALAGALVLVHVARSVAEPLAPAGWWLRLGLAGFGILLLGFAVFLVNTRILFTSTGIANRVSIAGALGLAVVLVALAGLAGALLRRAWVFAVGVAAVCATGFLVVNGLARDWEEAWERQREVAGAIERALPGLGPRETLLLDGVCPYVGPAIVFESSWDLAGTLRVRYGDPSLRADVTTSALTVGPEAVSTLLYGTIAARYSYGPGLVLFDYDRRSVRRLRDEQEAREYLAAYGDGARACPPGAAGLGSEVFPFDRLYARLEAKSFRPWS